MSEQQPFATFDLSDNAESRLLRESSATGISDLRKKRKGERNEQFGFKTTLLKRQQLQRLVAFTGKTQIEVIEEALDVYEDYLKKAAQKDQAL